VARSRLDVLARLEALEANQICSLRFRYDTHSPKDALRKHEFRVYSQNGEDGLLLFIFSVIGTTDRRFIEFGFGDGHECNTRNLSQNFGWTGLMIDSGDIALARRYLGKGVELAQATVEPENVNDLFRLNGYAGEIDLLSIDIDGNDYWVWKALQVVRPRVVVIEYNASFALNPVTIPYTKDFEMPHPYYNGASLEALTRLGRRKGYSLIGCDSNGCNAFFVRDDCVGGMPLQEPLEAFYPQIYRTADVNAEWDQVKSLPLEEVS
jgi:hypothetical protein